MYFDGFQVPFNIDRWIEAHRHLLIPPVANKLLFSDASGLVIQVIGGGNRRVDFHDDPAQEFFYQLKGDMILKIVEGGHFRDLSISQGDVFLLPPHVLHSPQRPDPDSIGLVVEGPRRHEDTDGFVWFCLNCGQQLHRVDIELKDIVSDLPPLFQAFAADANKRTCQRCGEVHPGDCPPADWGRLA